LRRPLVSRSALGGPSLAAALLSRGSAGLRVCVEWVCVCCVRALWVCW
jgi:hypothetical protein